MKYKLVLVAVMSLTWLLMTAAAMAVPIPGMFNTGVDNSGSPLGNNVVDPHWVLSAGPQGTPTAITGDPRPPSWVANTATSRWVTPEVNGNTGVLAGTYVYDLTFNLTGFLPSTASISGMWASDNNSSVFLNGALIATHVGGGTAFTAFDNFSTATGFLPGINTLTIQAVNAGGPAGVHVTALVGDATPVPEPTSGLLTFTLASWALVRPGKRGSV